MAKDSTEIAVETPQSTRGFGETFTGGSIRLGCDFRDTTIHRAYVGKD